MKVEIPQPCREKWHEMNPTTEGAFCNACQKEVIDFSDKTDYEIYQYFHKFKGDTCGRFRENQLNRELKFIPQNKWQNFKRSFLILPLLFGSRLLDAQSLDTSSTKSDLQIQEQSLDLRVLNQKIKGRVLDKESGTPLKGVHISIRSKGANQMITHAISNISGEFELEYNAQSSVIALSIVGYHNLEIPISSLEIPNNNAVLDLFLEGKITELEPILVEGYRATVSTVTTGTVCSITSKRKHFFFGRIWDFIKKPFIKKQREK